MSRAPEFESAFESDFAPKPESDSTSKLALDVLAALRPVTAPAVAAAALASAAGGADCARTDASPPVETGEADLGGTGLGASEAGETNLLAAAARAAEFPATFGACVGFLESVGAFLLFSLHVSRSFN